MLQEPLELQKRDTKGWFRERRLQRSLSWQGAIRRSISRKPVSM